MQGGHDNIEIAVAQHFGGRIRLAVGSDFFDEFVNHLEANLLMRFLAAFEPQFDPDLVIVAKELNGVVEGWRRDWESLDTERYLKHYSPAFRTGTQSHTECTRSSTE